MLYCLKTKRHNLSVNYKLILYTNPNKIEQKRGVSHSNQGRMHGTVYTSLGQRSMCFSFMAIYSSCETQCCASNLEQSRVRISLMTIEFTRIQFIITFQINNMRHHEGKTTTWCDIKLVSHFLHQYSWEGIKFLIGN